MIVGVAAVFVVLIVVLALLAPVVLAQAGGGSSGFGGGGGGGSGGGGGFGGGSSGGGYGGGSGSDSDGSAGIFEILFFLVFAAFLFGIPAMLRRRAREGTQRWTLARMRRRHDRAREDRDERVTTASAAAAEDDPAFAAAVIKAQAAALYADVQRAWTERDDAALERLLGGDLLVEWRRRLADFASKGWVNEVAVRRGPVVEYVGLVNRADVAEDRVTVAISATLHSVVRTTAGTIINRNEDVDRDGELEVCEYWTLPRSGDSWRLVSIEQEQEGAHHLDAPIVTAPCSDDARLSDESLIELATVDTTGGDTDVSDLVSVEFDGTAREKALDLSLADPRCGPAVLEVAARNAVQAWAEAVDGADAALLALATPEAAQSLLYEEGAAHGTARIVVRGPQLMRLAITALRTDSATPPMEVEALIRGRRYIEDRDTAAVVSGDKNVETEFTERWTFALDSSTTVPWRLVDGMPSRA